MRNCLGYLVASSLILQQGCAFVIIDRNPELPNGYEYFVPQAGMHMLVKEGAESVILGHHLNRAYINDRYILGEITIDLTNQDDSNPVDEFSYFIFDTKSGSHSSELSKNQFEQELRSLGIWNEVELVGRNSRFWLKKR